MSNHGCTLVKVQSLLLQPSHCIQSLHEKFMHLVCYKILLLASQIIHLRGAPRLKVNSAI
jgi:hypothetical protein